MQFYKGTKTQVIPGKCSEDMLGRKMLSQWADKETPMLDSNLKFTFSKASVGIG